MLASLSVGKRLAGLMVALFLLLSLAILVSWRALGIHTITGDEPHYLVIADGLVNGFELEQTGPYTREFRDRSISPGGLAELGAAPTPENTHAEYGPRGLFNVHNIGLPIVLAIPYMLGGEVGARIAMVLIATVAVVILLRLAALTQLTPRKQFMIVAPMAVGLPFVTGANQIYPDVPAGVIVLSGVYLLLRGKTREISRNTELAAVALAFLPWLHIRFGLPMVLLMCALWKAELPRRGLRRSTLLFVVPAFFSVALLGGYNLYAFGNPTGPYSSGDVMFNRAAVMQFLGLLFDQNQGLFMQQPLHFVGAFFLIRLARSNPLAVATTVVVMLSALIPNATHWNIYGGASFNGRFGWVATIAFMSVTILGLGLLLKDSPRVGYVILALGFAVQIRHLVAILIQHRLMLPHTIDGWMGTYSTFWRPIEMMLPHWRDPRWAFGFVPNIVVLLLFASTVVVGGLSNGADRWRPRAMTGVVGLTSIVLGVFGATATYAYPSMTWPGGSLPSQTGSVEGSDRIASQGQRAGLLSYGPYWRVPPGRYRATVNYSSSEPQSGAVDIYLPRTATTLLSQDFASTNGQDASLVLDFSVDERLWGETEIRTFYKGWGVLRLNWISLERTGDVG